MSWKGRFSWRRDNLNKKGRHEAGLGSDRLPIRDAISWRAGVPAPHTYFFGAIESFAALATRNFTTVFALI
jgi:hypothetical protein